MTDIDLDAIRARVAHQEHADDCYPDPDRDPYVGCACGETRTNRWRDEVRLLLVEVERLQLVREEWRRLYNAARTELDEVGQRSADRMVENHRLSEALDAVRALAEDARQNGTRLSALMVLDELGSAS